MNPMTLMKIKEKIDTFGREHPKVLPFFQTINRQVLTAGSILEIKVTDTDGKEYVSNIRVTENDLELIRTISELKSGGYR